MKSDTGLFYAIGFLTPDGSGHTQAPVGFEFDPTGKPWLWALLPGGIKVDLGRDPKTLKNALQALEQVESSGWHHPTRGGFLAGGPLRPNGADLRQALRAAMPPEPVWFGEYRGNDYYEFPGLRGIWNHSMRCAVRCTPGYEWRHEPLTPEEVEALNAAARACGFLD